MSAVPATMMESPSGSASAGLRILRVRTAGFFRRAPAAAIDLVVVFAVSAPLAALCAVLLDLPLPGQRQLAPDLLLGGLLDRDPVIVGGAGLFLVVGALYQIVMGGVGGQTLGKRVCGLRVISARGTAPGVLGGLGRFVALVLGVVPAGLGWLWFAFDRERRALHDHLAGTYVIIDVADR